MAGIWNPVFLMCALLLYVAIQDVNGRPQNNGEQPIFTGAVTSNPAWQPVGTGPVVPYGGSGNNGGGSCCCAQYPGSGGNGGSPGTPGQLNLAGTIELLEHILVKGKEVSQILNKVTGTAETRDNLNQVLQSLGQLISLLRSAQTMKLTNYQISILYYIQSIFMYPLLVCTYNLNALLKVIDKLKGLNLQMLDELVKSISDKLSTINNSLATLYGGINELIRYLSFILGGGVAAGVSIDGVIKPVLVTLNVLSTQLKQMITELRNKLGSIKQSDNANLQEILNCLGILPVVENLLGAVLAVLGGDESQLAVVNQLLKTLNELVGKGTLGDLLGGLLVGLFSVVQGVLTFLTGVLGGSALSGTLALVGGILNTLGSVTGGLTGALGSVTGGLTGALGSVTALVGGGQGGHNGGRGGGLLGGLLNA